LTISGERPFVGSSISRRRFSALSNARALAQLGKQCVHLVVPQRSAGPFGDPQVLRHRQRAEHIAILRHVPDAAPHERVRS
jgi:hypothetical protein